MSSNKDYSILEINDAKEKVDSFFSNRPDLADEFFDLLRYIKSLESKIVLRFNDQIIGASKPDSHYHFYALHVDDKYYIKFKCSEQKKEFTPISRKLYEVCCQETVKLIGDDPHYKLTMAKQPDNKQEPQSFTIPTNPSDFEPYYITVCDMALEKCRDHLEIIKDYPITPTLFGVRASNALNRYCISTMGELLNSLDARDLSRIRNLGEKSINNITKGCNTLLSRIGEEIPIKPHVKSTGWESLYEKSNRVIDAQRNKGVSFSKIKDSAEELCGYVRSFFVDCLNEGPFLTPRQNSILYMREIDGRTLQDVGAEFDITRERVRQVCIQSERQLVARIKKHIIDYPRIAALAVRIEEIEDSVFLEYMAYIKRESLFIWRCLSSLIADKHSQNLLRDLVDNYSNLLPEYDRLMAGGTKQGNREEFGIKYQFIDYYYPKTKFRMRNTISHLIIDLKYGPKDASMHAAREVKEILKSVLHEGDTICIVPASTVNGNNRLTGIVNEIAEERTLDVVDCFKRIKNKRSYARYGGTRNPAKDKETLEIINASRIRNKDIILLDDVCTSGSTFKACRDLLYENNARDVRCICLGSTVDMKEREKHLFAILCIPGMGKKTLYRILNDNPDFIDYNDYESTLNALKPYEKQYSRIKLPTVEKYEYYLGKAENIIEHHQKEGIDTISYGSNLYPLALTQIDTPPILLYAKGNLNLLSCEDYVAVIGSRNVSEHGAKVAKRLGNLFAEHGEIVVSGLALGCDMNAHLGCLDAKGKTIAILPSPIDNVLPKSNEELANEIVKSDGLLLSEYYSGQEVINSFYADRDRLQSGISNGVVVVETSSDGGTMITVDKAFKYGKVVGCYVHPEKYRDNKSLDGNRQLLQSNGVARIDNSESIESFIKKMRLVRERIKLASKEEADQQLSFNI